MQIRNSSADRPSPASSLAWPVLAATLALMNALGLVGCDPAASGSSSPSSTDASGSSTSQRMFEAQTAASRGDEDTAVSIYSELCGNGHAEACEELMTRAESDEALKQKLCHDLRYARAC